MSARRPSLGRISPAIRILENAGLSDVAKFLMAKEKYARDAAKPKRKRKVTLRTKSGRKVELFETDVKRMSDEP